MRPVVGDQQGEIRLVVVLVGEQTHKLLRGCRTDLHILCLVEVGWAVATPVHKRVSWAPRSSPSPNLRLRVELQRQVPALGCICH